MEMDQEHSNIERSFEGGKDFLNRRIDVRGHKIMRAGSLHPITSNTALKGKCVKWIKYSFILCAITILYRQYRTKDVLN
jgi:hypothetical protein